MQIKVFPLYGVFCDFRFISILLVIPHNKANLDCFDTVNASKGPTFKVKIYFIIFLLSPSEQLRIHFTVFGVNLASLDKILRKV